MTNEAPETIWAYGNSVCDDWDCDEGDWTKQKSCSEDWPHAQYIRTDLHLAEVAAVKEAAIDAVHEECWTDGDQDQVTPAMLPELLAEQATTEIAIRAIRALTPDDATAALERVKREARVEALRDAADMLENGNGIGGQLSAKRVRAMIEKEQTDE